MIGLRILGLCLFYWIYFYEFDELLFGKIMEIDKFIVYVEKLDYIIFCMGYCVV